MTSKLDPSMLQLPVVSSVALNGNALTITCTDASMTTFDVSQIPALAPVADMLTKIAAINAYIAAHP
jgi:riboflavin synthase alpha subunit